MNKLLLFTLLLLCFPSAFMAQTVTNKVGVNTRTPSENLDIDGTLRIRNLPLDKQTNAHHTDNLGQTSSNRDQTFIAHSTVVADKNGVLGTMRGLSNWFFMPSITVDTSVSGTPLQLDLYAEFQKQFLTPRVSSTGAPVAIMPVLPNKQDLYYYITDYDTDVLTHVSIDGNGMMSYTVGTPPSEYSFINIVFVLK